MPVPLRPRSYDFQEGTVIFLAPGQVVSPSDEAPAQGGDADLGWMMFFHPSLLHGSRLLFGYFQRYCGRQFLTRAGAHRDALARFEEILDLGFSGEPRSLPTVKGCAERLGYSPDYLSDLLRKETGRSAQEHIHERLVDRAKDLLLGTRDPVDRVAYSLGFAYPQHFSKLFKTLTGRTPGKFRREIAG